MYIKKVKKGFWNLFKVPVFEIDTAHCAIVAGAEETMMVARKELETTNFVPMGPPPRDRLATAG